MALSHHEKRNARAKQAGFKNYYEFRKATGRRDVQKVLRAARVKSGFARYEIAALAAGKRNLKERYGRKGTRKRLVAAGVLSDAVRRAGGTPSGFWKALGSPKKKKGK